MTLIPRGELLPYKGNFYLWNYIPSMAAAVIFLLLFLVASLAHSWRMYHERLWFCLPFVIGGYLEVIGYIGRAMAVNATDQLGPYIIQSVFLLVPPSLFAASIYMTLGRIMRALGPVGESCSFIRVSRLTTIFVLGDVFAFLVQSSGAGYMAAGSSSKTGENIVIGGLLIQIIFFGLFVVAAVSFHLRYRQSASSLAPSNVPWQSMLTMLYVNSALILVRSIFRIAEYAMGSTGYLLQNEWPLYVFDSVLMLAVMVVFYKKYPSDIGKALGLGGKTGYAPAAV
ncbi:hypothetical protein PFICI_04314 [Pestalotiopsis fici W106-1]|uniref:Protein RTA1 n=1 Tax=Pestalotiopsis fici (strain W106-1 / CGMCC3.15140) TaxID=1229662 RepID=W3X8J1_PESFW|nr:uncharacterized protein PFICI_04314 [Pestalotiopsis fici W106-1]ETS82438.1 hypothetical protein PFICI_04314 [Pestalotiopsis fici W106-1]